MTDPRGKGRRTADDTPTVPFARCPVCGRAVELKPRPAGASAGPDLVNCPWCWAPLEVEHDGTLKKRKNGGP